MRIVVLTYFATFLVAIRKETLIEDTFQFRLAERNNDIKCTMYINFLIKIVLTNQAYVFMSANYVCGVKLNFY